MAMRDSRLGSRCSGAESDEMTTRAVSAISFTASGPRMTRAAVAALTPTAWAISAHVHCCIRSTFIPSAIAAAVWRGLECGRLDRSVRPAGPSAR